ncbi:MAG: protein kinase [Gammaproteobacteria bacterium]
MRPGPQDVSTLTVAQRARLDALLDELLDLPEHERVAALHHRSVEDPQVAEALESWLRAVQASNDFLSTPPRPEMDEWCLPDPTIGVRLGAWRLTRLIGRGGMGDVYEAIRADGEFEQRVAIKLLQRGTAGESRRFQTERQILARLDHAGIARLFDGGVTEDSRLYMVMEYVEGRPITEFCHAQGADFAQRLDLFMQACDAVSFAHRNNVIHRDLKPSNILVTAEGAVKLLDFGIAQLQQTQLARVTQAGIAPMTPICAAPEQLTGQPTSPATDVYALGLLLFELLSGTHPWMSYNTHILQAMRTVLERPAPLASSAADAHGAPPVPARRIRGDLDAIIAKSLRKESAHRYATVEALKADVKRLLRGEAVEARKHARLYVVGHWLRRYRWPLSGVLGVMILLILGRNMLPAAAAREAHGHTVALVGFKNLSRQEDVSWLPAALTEMLDTEMSSAEQLRVIPEDLVIDVTKGMQQTENAGYGLDTLQGLGRKLRADYVISGNYLVSSAAGDPKLRIDVAVEDVKSGKSITRFSQQASLSSLPEMVSKMGTTLRKNLGAATPSMQMLAQISNAQPPSVDVAQKLSLARQAMQHYDAARARDELLQVIAESPGFAPAYASLAEAWATLGYREKATAAAQQAQTRASGLSSEMQLQIDAALQAAKYQWPKASSDWNALIKLKPANPEYRLQAIDAALNAGEPGNAQVLLTALQHLDDAAQDARVALAAARVACALDDSKSCAKHAAQALRLALALQAPGLAADARHELAVAMMHLGNIDEATENSHGAIEAYRAIGNPRGESEAHITLGRVLIDSHHEAEARAEYQKAMAIAQRIDDLGGVSAVYRNLCELLWDNGDRDGAEAAGRRGLELSLQTGDLKLQAWTLRALATIASDDSASDEVMRNYRQVTALTERSGDRGGHVWSLATYAETARLRGELAEAHTTCAQALAEAAQLSDPQFIVYSLYTCALVEWDRGRSDTAVDMLLQVERKSEASKNSTYLANARLMLAQIDLEGLHCIKALQRLGQAIDEFALTESHTGQAEAEALRAACYQQLGDSRQRDDALARARTLRAAITSRLEVYTVEIVSAQLGFAVGRHRDAIAQLNALAVDAAHRHWLRWSLEAQLAAWQLAEANGDERAAMRLRAALERSARVQGMGRILVRLGQPPDWATRGREPAR